MSYFFRKIKIILKKKFSAHFFTKKIRPQNGHFFRKKNLNYDFLSVFTSV